MRIRIEIEKKWFEENKSKLIWNDKYDDVKIDYYAIEYDAENQERLIDDDGSIKISAYNGISVQTTVIETHVEPETLINLAQIITKYYNRAKTLFESLK